MAQTVAIIGAGIGGVYLAADLGLRGVKLRLHDRDDTRLADIRDRGGIEVEGEPSGFAAIERVTPDLAAAVDGADIVVLCTGGTYQEDAATGLAPLLQDGQLILLIQGNTGGSLAVRRALDRAGCRAAVDIAEIDNYPYSCWRLGPARIRPIVRKKWLQIAAFPGNRIAAVFARLSPLFPRGGCGAERSLHRLHQRQRDAACRELRRQRRQDRPRRGLQILRRGRDSGGRPAVSGDQRRAGRGRRRARRLGADPRRLVRAGLWRARRRSLRNLPVADHQQRRPVSGDRHAEIVGAQIHRRGRAGRADADAARLAWPPGCRHRRSTR